MKSHKTLLAIALMFSILFLPLVRPAYSQSSPYHEAPMLAEQVKAGKLPPVEKRLPNNPMIVEPEDKIGIYGGTWHMAMAGDDRNFTYRTLGYEGLMRWDSQWTRVIPNVAQSYTVSADTTEYTFSLRQGMRWSDGELFTADDILFWYKGVFLNKDLTAVPFPWLMVGGKPVVVEKKNDYTVVFRFAAPNGLFLQRLATPDGLSLLNYPKHYLSQFHADYNPQVADLVSKAGLKTWIELFQKKAPIISFTLNWEVPSLNPWVLATDYFGGGSVLRAVRNPYYWKVDTDFGQLPYIDNVEYAIVKDSAAVTELAIKGQIDMQQRSIQAVAAEAKNAQQGGYRTYQGIPSTSTTMAIAFNLNHADPAKRAIFQNRDFRIGLSYAINRAKTGNTEPVQVAPVKESPLYNEKFSKQYTQYDVQKANESLDKAGFAKRDADGFRLNADGKRISFKILVANPLPGVPNALDIVAQIRSDWRAVGIEAELQQVPRQEAEASFGKNEFDATVWGGDGGFEVILEPRYYFPFSIWSLYGLLWAKWFNNPQDPLAEEPSAAARRQMELYGKLQMTDDANKQLDFMKQIIDISAEEFYVIGLNRPPIAFGIVKNNFRNVPAIMPLSYSYPDPAPTNPCQYYIDPNG